MIKLKVSLAGTDKDGKVFSCMPGDNVSLDAKSEQNMVNNEMAEPVKATVKKAAKK